MSNNSDAYVPFNDEGEGYTEDQLGMCHAIAELSRPKLLRALDNVPCDGKSPFTICDYATADGTASMPHIKELIGKLRAKHGESLPIQIIYEDQPNNDYKSLVRRIHGLNSDNESSLLDETSNLFILICSTGFHRQCLPPNTVDLGFSRAAMHYMKKLPCNITGALHSSGLTVPEEIRMFKEQAAREWDHLLLARAKEMKQGGRLIIDAAAIDEHGRYLGNYECRVNLFQRLAELWKQMMDEGLITKEEFDNTNIYHYFRTKEEFIAPLVDAESGVYKAGLRLISCEMNCVMCPHRKRWMAKMKRGN